VTSTTIAEPSVTNINYNKIREFDVEKDAAWKRVVQEFKNQVLDPSYLVTPIRSSTIEAASLYVPTTTADATSATTSTTTTTSSSDVPYSINNNLMPGSHKHLGGAYDKTDGCIYGVPANSKSVLCLYPVDTDGNKIKIVAGGNNTKATPVVDYRITTIPLPESVHQYQFKWLRGIFAHGYMWAIPSWANCVLCVDIDKYWGRRGSNNDDGTNDSNYDDFITLIPLPPGHELQTWQWHGAGINREQNAIYCIPSNAKQVLKVDLITKTTSFIPIEGYDVKSYPNFSIDMTNKWYGGIVGVDNCVYGIPYRSCAVLKINCNTDTATLVGPDYGSTQYNWHGGIQVHGKIYAHPSHADTVLVIDTTITDSSSSASLLPICTELPIVRASYDTCDAKTYKWLGGTVGVDGNIYCPACDASAVLKIDVTTQLCTTFGFAGTLKNKVCPINEWRAFFCYDETCFLLHLFSTSSPISVENHIFSGKVGF
jgi:hypothetical protein